MMTVVTDLSMNFLKVVESSAIAAAKTMGQGDRRLSDLKASEAMREALETMPIFGTVVIGEGERDESPMICIGEKVGNKECEYGSIEVDLAVDPLEGKDLCSTEYGQS